MDTYTPEFRIRTRERFDRLGIMEENEFASWLDLEADFWMEIVRVLHARNETPSTTALVSSYLNLIEQIKEENEGTKRLEDFHATTPLPFHDETPFKSKLLEFAEKGQLSVAIYAYQTAIVTKNSYFVKTYEDDLKDIEEKLKKNIYKAKADFTSDIKEKLSEFTTSAEIAHHSSIENLASEIEKAKLEVSNTVTAATAAILSAEPVKYWVEREAKHKNKAETYLRLIGIAAVTFVSALIFLTVSVYKNGESYSILGISITLPAEKYSIAILVIATTSAIWLIRVLVKLMMTNLALEIEALERSTMIRTYIAMENSKAEQAAEIRMLFYSTLFKPSNNSLTDDSTSPEYIRIIEAMLQKKA